MCAGCERLNNRSPKVNTCEAMCWLSNVTFNVFWTIILENVLHFHTMILLLDFTLNIFHSLIKYHHIAAVWLIFSLWDQEEEWVCTPLPEVLRCNQKKIVYLESRSSEELYSTKSSLYLLKYVLKTLIFSWWSTSLSAAVVAGRLLLNNIFNLVHGNLMAW